MHRLNVNEKYKIYIENSFDNLLKYIKQNNIPYDNIVILTDDNVKEHYLSCIENIFKDKNVFSYVLKQGEETKNINTVCDVYEFLLNNNIDRKSLLVSLGGGVVGDISGFVASTYMRGINYIQIPTSLLAQVDSSIGGKTGVDFMNKKNIVGTFYNPSLVFININTLKTLPKEHIQNSMAEVIKCGYILDENYLNYINLQKEKILNYNMEVFTNIVYKCCKLKMEIVTKDEKEQNIREILNFGHTFGHAIESVTDFKILHGKAVAMGIVASMYISYKLNKITKDDLQNAKNILSFFNLYNKIPLDAQKIYEIMLYDKKNINKNIKIIILIEIGSAISTSSIEKTLLIDAINYSLEG